MRSNNLYYNTSYKAQILITVVLPSSHHHHYHHLPSFCSTHDHVSHGKILCKTCLISCICKCLKCCSLFCTYILFVFLLPLSMHCRPSLKLSVVFLSNGVYLIPIILGLRYILGFSCSLPNVPVRMASLELSIDILQSYEFSSEQENSTLEFSSVSTASKGTNDNRRLFPLSESWNRGDIQYYSSSNYGNHVTQKTVHVKRKIKVRTL